MLLLLFLLQIKGHFCFCIFDISYDKYYESKVLKLLVDGSTQITVMLATKSKLMQIRAQAKKAKLEIKTQQKTLNENEIFIEEHRKYKIVLSHDVTITRISFFCFNFFRVILFL
jgi:hypothetical protein